MENSWIAHDFRFFSVHGTGQLLSQSVLFQDSRGLFVTQLYQCNLQTLFGFAKIDEKDTRSKNYKYSLSNQIYSINIQSKIYNLDIVQWQDDVQAEVISAVKWIGADIVYRRTRSILNCGALWPWGKKLSVLDIRQQNHLPELSMWNRQFVESIIIFVVLDMQRFCRCPTGRAEEIWQGARPAWSHSVRLYGPLDKQGQVEEV